MFLTFAIERVLTSIDGTFLHMASLRNEWDWGLGENGDGYSIHQENNAKELDPVKTSCYQLRNGGPREAVLGDLIAFPSVSKVCCFCFLVGNALEIKSFRIGCSSPIVVSDLQRAQDYGTLGTLFPSCLNS